MKRKRNESKENKNASDANVVKNCGQHVIKDTSKYRELLLKWYDATCRTLPRRTVAKQETDPNVRGYQVWVSEIMLQQTQVEMNSKPLGCYALVMNNTSKLCS